MKITTAGISDEDFKQHLRFIRHHQQTSCDAARLILADGEIVDGLITTISGNFFDIETLPRAPRVQMFNEVASIEYPAGST